MAVGVPLVGRVRPGVLCLALHLRSGRESNRCGGCMTSGHRKSLAVDSSSIPGSGKSIVAGSALASAGRRTSNVRLPESTACE